MGGITRRGFGKLLAGGTALATLESVATGCRMLGIYDTDFSQRDFEDRVARHYAAFKERFARVDPSWTTGKTSLFIEGASEDAYEKLDKLVAGAHQEASAAKTPEERLTAFQQFIERGRPYKGTARLADTVTGPNSDCDTRSLFIMEAFERMGSNDLSLVIVPQHAYLRLGQDPKKNWETTVAGGGFFDIQDHLNPRVLNAEGKKIDRAIATAVHAYQSAFNQYPDVSFDYLSQAVAIERFAVESAQDPVHRARALYNLGGTYLTLFEWRKEPAYALQSRNAYRASFDLSDDPRALLNLEKTYSSALADNDESRKTLSEASEAAHRKQKEIMAIAQANPVLYFKESARLGRVIIDIHKRHIQMMEETGKKEELIATARKLIDLLEQTNALDEQMYEQAVTTRGIVKFAESLQGLGR